MDSLDSLLPSVPIGHCSWKALKTAFSVYTELMCVSHCWTAVLGCPCVVVHRRMLLMSLFLLLQQCLLVCLTWMVSEMGNKWSHNCFVGCCFQDSFKTIHSIFAFPMSILTLLLVDEILLPRYVNYFTDFRSLTFNVAPSSLKKHDLYFIWVHIEANASCCLFQAM